MKAMLAMLLKVAVFTHPGRIRGHNEDAWGIFGENDFWTSEQQTRQRPFVAASNHADNLCQFPLLLAVSDGLGGANAGEMASRMVIRALPELIQRGIREGWNQSQQALAKWMDVRIRDIHAQLLCRAAGSHELKGMGATLSCLWLEENWITIGHVGDSRIYRWRDGLLEQLTEDHTYVWRLWKAGRIDAAEARQHPEKHLIEQVLGSSFQKNFCPQVENGSLSPGDLYLICSDGLSESLTDEQIASIIREHSVLKHSLESLLIQMMESALEVSGRDNITILLLTLQG